MRIIVRKMTREEYAAFYRWSFRNQMQELMEEENLTTETAEAETRRELENMLPRGAETAGNHLMSIARVSDGKPVGYLWTADDELDGVKQCFVCDFMIFPEERRQGYAEEALYHLDCAAKAAGQEECVLFVKNRNIIAQRLYQKCGYEMLREHSYGAFWRKKYTEPDFEESTSGAGKNMEE